MINPWKPFSCPRIIYSTTTWSNLGGKGLHCPIHWMYERKHADGMENQICINVSVLDTAWPCISMPSTHEIWCWTINQNLLCRFLQCYSHSQKFGFRLCLVAPIGPQHLLRRFEMDGWLIIWLWLISCIHWETPQQFFLLYKFFYRIKIDAVEPEISSFLFHAFFFLVKTSCLDSNNATRPPTVQSEIWVCCSSSS